MPGGQDKSLRRRDAEILVVSVAILYLELLLIRWLGTEIRVFAYLANLVLVVCFFGVGLGCYRAAQPASLTRLGVNVLLLAGLIANGSRLGWVDLKRVTVLLSGFEDAPIWRQLWSGSGALALGGLVIAGALLYLVCFCFAPAGQLLGRWLQEHPRVIRAYSVNLAGSLLGVWLFNAVSWLSWSPAGWFGLFAVLMLTLVMLVDRRQWVGVACTAAAAGLVWLGEASDVHTVWSPYHKLTLTPAFAGTGAARVQQGYALEADNTFYMTLLNLSESFLKAHPEVFDSAWTERSDYNLAFRFKRPIRSMLIVGAGAGNNAAAALRHDVEQVDCVEIDPEIYALGRQLHPEHPYDSPRVRMIVDDARAWFKRADERYDVIWFGWLDSQTLGSSYNNLHLDHYVYTRESLREAKRLLTQDGLIIINFGFRRWIADRLSGVLKQEFGHEPLAYWEDETRLQYGIGGGVTLVCGQAPLTAQQIADPWLREFVQAHRIRLPGTTRPTTDDWPYVYLERAKIPRLHLISSLAILGTVAVAGRRALKLRNGWNTHFFALGAAFLLLEVQTVSRAALLFGMTWVVNAIVISAVLVMVLLSNLVAARWARLPQWTVAMGLAATVVALAVVPLDWFNALPATPKLLAASAFLTAPVFFAGLIFIRSFASCPDKANALGSNLIGALVGGLLESLSFVTGIRALVLLVGAFYLWALLSGRPKQLQAAAQ